MQWIIQLTMPQIDLSYTVVYTMDHTLRSFNLYHGSCAMDYSMEHALNSFELDPGLYGG